MSSENNRTPEMMMQEVYDLLVKYGLNMDGEDRDLIKSRLDELGVESIEDLATMEEEELTGMGMKAAKVRRLLNEAKKLCGTEDGEAATLASPVAAPMLVPGMMQQFSAVDANVKSLLPELPDDASWFTMLCCSDKLTMSRGVALSAGLALIFGKYDIRSLPKKVMALMVEQDYMHNQPASDTYWRLRNITRKKDHSEILAAMVGGATPGITNAERKEVMARMEKYIRPKLLSCYDVALGIGKKAQSIEATFGGVMPDCEPLYSAAEELRRSLNMALAGPGAVAATDIAMDYSDFGKIFEFEDLYMRCGVADRDELLTAIDMGVTSLAVRQERYVRQFILVMIDMQMIPVEQQGVFCRQLGQLVEKIDRRLLAGDDAPASELQDEGYMYVDADVRDAQDQIEDGTGEGLDRLESVTGKKLGLLR